MAVKKKFDLAAFKKSKSPSIKRAKLIESSDLIKIMRYIDRERTEKIRDKVTILLSVKAGLRAAEIAKLAWADVTKANGEVSDVIEVTSMVKKGRYRQVPMHPDLKNLLITLRKERPNDDLVRYGDYKPTITPNALTVWFSRLFEAVELEGCSSHSGRRTFGTTAARIANLHNASLNDVKELMGHSDISTTQRYIDPSPGVVDMIRAM